MLLKKIPGQSSNLKPTKLLNPNKRKVCKAESREKFWAFGQWDAPLIMIRTHP